MTEETTEQPVAEKPEQVDEDSKIVFYCKDCQGVVAGKRIGTKYHYKCGECNSKRVGFGTLRSVKEFYMRKQ